MEGNYTKLKNEIYKLQQRMQSKPRVKKWIKSEAYYCFVFLEDICNDIDSTNKKDHLPTRINVYDYGFEIVMPHNSDKVTNACMRYEDILNIEHDQDLSSLFVLFRGNDNAQHYAYPDVSKEDYELLKQRYLDRE